MQFKITSHIRATMREETTSDPVGKQYLPDPREGDVAAHERADPIGDDAHSPLQGLVHRYPDRVLLKVTDTCAVYCRFCFRKEMVGKGRGVLPDEALENAFSYIERAQGVREVILSGGDPLILSARRLGNILRRLDAIAHIDNIRIHTRVPVADPSRVDARLLEALGGVTKPLYVVLHINHANEMVDAVVQAAQELHKAGAMLLSQSVLLRGVNDDAATLEALFRALIRYRIKPYYLHHPDLAPGNGHFRVSIEEGQALMRALRGRLSGIALPTYVLDIPGGYGKVPIGPVYIRQAAGGGYAVTDGAGDVHAYRDIFTFSEGD